MNPLNYATLPAAQRLTENGIVLETEHYWVSVENEYVTNQARIWKLTDFLDMFLRKYDHVPAPSMAEVWRELPDATQIILIKRGVFHVVHYASNAIYTRRNPTDALIDLLIWVTERGCLRTCRGECYPILGKLNIDNPADPINKETLP